MDEIWDSIANLINSFAHMINEMDFIDLLMMFLIILLFMGKAPEEFQNYAYQWIGTMLVYLTNKKYQYGKLIWQYINLNYNILLSNLGGDRS
jgi:hypothetical protein